MLSAEVCGSLIRWDRVYAKCMKGRRGILSALKMHAPVQMCSERWGEESRLEGRKECPGQAQLPNAR